MSLSTTIQTANIELFQKLVKNQKTIVATFDTHLRSSWDYLKNELEPLLKSEWHKDLSPLIVIIAFTKLENKS